MSRAQIGILSGTLIAAACGVAAFGVLSARERRRAPDRERLLRPLDPTRDPVLGDAARAVVTVVEYGDFTSPFSPGSEEMRREMTSRFGTAVAYTFRHLRASDAALATEAAAAQGRFWGMRDALLRDAPVESERQVLRAASEAGGNLRRLQVDRGRGVGARRVDEDTADAEAMALDTAPSFFIGDVRYEGPIDADAVNTAVAEAVAAARA